MRVQGYSWGAHVFFFFIFLLPVCVRATRGRLEPVWCTVAWLLNVSCGNESLSWGWCVTPCAQWRCMYGSVCASWSVCRCLHSGTACLLWSVIYVGVGIWGLLYTSVSWRACVWVHSYVCIFPKIVFRHVTHSTFYACGVICNACWVHKGDYVTV